MQIYLAPLQGLTDWIFRESFTQHIGSFDKTFTPFVRVQNGDFFRPSQCNDLLPEHNHFQKPVPQFLGNDTESFKRFENLCLENNYTEANINMGCPYPMVTGRKMGAGILSHPEIVSELLKGIFASTNLKISIKCRLGMENPTELEQLIPVFNDYPLSEIIIHPRIGKQQYKGSVNAEAFVKLAEQIKHPVFYNGDILTAEDAERIQKLIPVAGIMIGRGVLQNPFLLDEIRNKEIILEEKRTKLRNFHLGIIENCKQKYSGDGHFLKRLEEMWSYHAENFINGKKVLKQIKKCRTFAEYEEIVFRALNEL